MNCQNLNQRMLPLPIHEKAKMENEDMVLAESLNDISVCEASAQLAFVEFEEESFRISVSHR